MSSPKCVVLYATGSGTAKTYATRLAEVFKKRFQTEVWCMDEYCAGRLVDEPLVLLVTSTLGNGEPPHNGVKFACGLHDLLFGLKSTKRVLLTDCTDCVKRRTVSVLSKTTYSVFGLGSRAFPSFCEFAKLLDQMLQDLGGSQLCKLGTGDELGGQEQAFIAWADTVLQKACKRFSVQKVKEPVMGSQEEQGFVAEKFRLNLTVYGERSEKSKDDLDVLRAAFAKTHKEDIISTTMMSRTNLHSNKSSRQTILAKLRIDPRFPYKESTSFAPGDHLAIFPSNPPYQVAAILNRIDFDSSDNEHSEYQLEYKTETGTWSRDSRLPSMPVRVALSRFLDVMTPPTPYLLRQMASFATDQNEKAKLLELANDEAKYSEWKFGRYPSLADVLREFASLKLPATFVVSQLPLLQPRFYSISSSPDLHPGQIHVTAAVLDFTTNRSGENNDAVLHRGLCSSWMQGMDEGEHVLCFIRRVDKFHMPAKDKTPIIMVGPGTGIAPFRAFWQHRQAAKQKSDSPDFGEMVLYSGCRDDEVDELFSEEKQEAKSDGVLTQVYTAVSRKTNNGRKYVQDYLLDHQDHVVDLLIKEKAHLYVCGDVHMAHQVVDTVKQLLIKDRNWTGEDAEKYILEMKEENRLHVDVYGITLKTSELYGKATKKEALDEWMRSAGLCTELYCARRKTLSV